MNKKIIKLLVIGFFILFLFFYYFGNNIYQSELTEKRDLTLEQIKKFELDVKEGKEIDISDYVIKKKNYNNNITKINDNISNFIGKGFKKVFEYLLRNIDV